MCTYMTASYYYITIIRYLYWSNSLSTSLWVDYCNKNFIYWCNFFANIEYIRIFISLVSVPFCYLWVLFLYDPFFSGYIFKNNLIFKGHILVVLRVPPLNIYFSFPKLAWEKGIADKYVWECVCRIYTITIL